MLRINKIYIKGIGPIKEFEMEFNPHFNIICGANGIGKTTILNCIAQTFGVEKTTLRKNSKVDEGSWKTIFVHNNNLLGKETKVKTSKPNVKAEITNPLYGYSKEIVYYKTERTMDYTVVDSISKDRERSPYEMSLLVSSGTPYKEIKEWLINRYLWSAHEGELSMEQVANLKLALECFNYVNEGFCFKKIDPETNDIIIDTPLGDIVFEQLSSGYISLIILLVGIIKDIEYRFKSPHIKVTDFEGILIVDEIDVHLHPELQALAYTKLTKMLAKAQIFTSTHSPHVIQVAEPDEIIPLVSDGSGDIRVNSLSNSEYGFKGWTVEEILTDVMGMRDTKTELYENTLKEFNAAVDAEDREAADKAFAELDKMLHPKNVLRQVLEIQKI